MKLLKKSIIVLMVICGVILTGCGKKEDAVTPGKLGDPAAPLIGLEWVKGEPVTIQPGNVYVVEFWATWCPPCRASIPHLTKLQAEYKDKVTIVGVSLDDAPARKVKDFVTKQGEAMEYTVAYEKKGKVSRAYSRAFGQRYIPHAFIVDRQGKIVWVGSPMGMDDALKQIVEGTFDAVAYAEQKKQIEANAAKLQGWQKDYFAKVGSGNSEGTVAIADQIIEIADPGLLNEFAWNILTKVKEENRDMDVALKAAGKANDMTKGKQPAVLDTYAFSLFQSGKVQDAIAQQTKAVELLAGRPKAQQGYSKRLEEYKAALTKVATSE